MSNSGGGWQSPSGEPIGGEHVGDATPDGTAAAPAPAPAFAPPPAYGPAFGAPVSPPVGWTPPPKPGLIPLRPLSFGALLGAPFRILRRSRALIGLAIALQLATLIITFGLVFGVIFGLATRITDPSDPTQQPLIAGTVAGAVLAVLALIALSLVTAALLQGFVVVSVARGTLGRGATMRTLWGRVKPHLWHLVLWTAVLGVATLIVIVIVGLIGVSGLALGDPVGLAVSIPIAIIIGLGAFVGVVFVTVKLSLVPSALVLERLPLRHAITRSWRLTQQNFWRTLGLQLLITVIMSVAAQIIATPFSLLPLLGVVIDPNGTGASVAISIISTLLSSAVSVVIGAVSSIVVSAAISLIYIDIRMRKEGLDLTLQRWVEQPDERDPFIPGAV